MDRRNPDDRFRRRIQSLRIIEFTLSESGHPDKAQMARNVIMDLVTEYNAALPPARIWRG
jgi:hypothetical protein